MRRKVSLDNYYTAGAWYRLLKSMLTRFSVELPSLMGMKTADAGKIASLNNRFSGLEMRCGFENLLEKDYGEILDNANFSHMFYGDLTEDLGRKSITEFKVRKQALSILEEISKSIKESLGE